MQPDFEAEAKKLHEYLTAIVPKLAVQKLEYELRRMYQLGWDDKQKQLADAMYPRRG